jgi:hypothetical protein
MGTQGGPGIVTDGLVLSLDAANKKSYPGSGTAWTDLSGAGKSGTLTNGPVFSSDNVGIIDFDGSNDYIQLQSDGTGTFNNQIFSLGMWFKVDVLKAYNVLFSYDYTAHSAPYYATHLRIEVNGKVTLAWNDGSTLKTAVTVGTGLITADTWYNIYVTFKPTLRQIFVNGVLVRNSTTTNTITFYNQEVWIGRSNFSSGYTNGKITLFNYYNRELSSSEILHNYNATKSRFGL